MSANIEEILEFFKRSYELKFRLREPFKVLVATLLSQRTREEITEKAATSLFKLADSPRKILRLTEKQLARLIYPVGFYRQKAKKIRIVCKVLLKKYGGKVPRDREKLLNLPGVGDKTADVVLCYGFGVPSIAIDTHCNRIPKRIGIVPESASLREVKEILERLVPIEDWYVVNLGFVNFGREICKPVKPRCEICPFKNFCKHFRQKSKVPLSTHEVS